MSDGADGAGTGGAPGAPGRELEGEVALVTGASRGIGRAIAEALGAAGATVAGTATSEAGATGIAERFAAAGIAGGGFALDVRDADACAATLDAVASAHGPVTILVNNAGITRDNLFLRMKDEEWEDVIATNLSAVYRLCRLVVRPMVKARRGRIVNVGSVVGQTGNAGQVNYAAAKAGLAGLTMSLARELGSRNVTVNTVAPGFIASDMTDALGDERRAALEGTIALGRLGAPEDVASAVRWLCSPGAAYVTGQTIGVNGGMHMG